MLAVMQSPPPLPVHTRMSLAVLPSAPMTYSPASGSVSALAPSSPAASKRPKLSLNTSDVQLSVFGKGSTSLRLETLSCTSPTSRNTFSNRDAQGSSITTQQKPTLAPLTTSPSTVNQEPETTQDCASSASTASSSTTDSSSIEVPYRVAFHTTSILVNSPIPRKRTRKSTLGERTMFPPPKKVAFRSPLTEEVKTTKYTMKHSDIESSSSSISTLELSPQQSNGSSTSSNKSDDRDSQHAAHRVTSSPHIGDKRESSSDEEDSDDSCPSTPLPGREKRSRIWAWTLGPIEQTSSEQRQPCKEPALAEQAKDKA